MRNPGWAKSSLFKVPLSAGESYVHRISKAVIRDDAADKSSGKAKYLSDLRLPGMLYLVVKPADIQHARVLNIYIPKLPENYTVITGKDFKGQNRATIIAEDWPFFAEDEVLYYGQPLLAVAGPELDICEELCSKITAEYEGLPAVSTIEEAQEFFNDFHIVKGEPEQAFKNAALTFDNAYRTGMQEQAYMEPQAMIADFQNGMLTVQGSMQCPYYVKNSLMNALALNADKVRVIQTVTGGAFGGKEDFPSILAGQAAAAAIKTGRPVKVVLDRRLDMQLTPKRHPSLIHIRTAVDQEGQITAMDIDCRIDAGAYQTLSAVVLERAIFICTGAYNIKNVHVRGRTMKTNHIPSGAFRGFGGPQAHFAADMNMHFLAHTLGIPPLELKKKYLYRQGDHSVTNGTFRDQIKFNEMIEKIEEASEYSSKWEEYNRKAGSRPYRGVGISFAAHGGAFTGSGEQDIIKSLVRLSAESAASDEYIVRVLVSNVEMGQGASTTLRKIVAEAMHLPLERIIFNQSDTSEVPDSGPTVASRTIMIVGKLLHDAAKDLLQKIDSGPLPTKEKPIETEKRYVHPQEFEWDESTFTGDAYPGYSWSVNVVEVEVDPLTYVTKVIGSWAVYDVGTPIDIHIVKGQMQGGTAQSLGYAYLEKMEMSNGRPAQLSFTDYTIPTTLDFPDLQCRFIDNPYRLGPYGAKAAGELPNIGPAAAFAAAVSQATGTIITTIPVTPEKLEAELR